MKLLRLLAPFALSGLAVWLHAAPAPVNPLPATPPQPTEITSEKFDMRSTATETISVFSGRVVVTGTGLRLTCDHLEVVSSRIGDKEDTVGKQDRFRSLIATGQVRIRQGDREASCGRAEVRPREDKIILTENPVVTDHGSEAVATGDEIVMLRGDRRVSGLNVKMTFPSIRNLGFDPKQPAPAPAPVPASDAKTPAAPDASSTPQPPVTVPGLPKADATK